MARIAWGAKVSRTFLDRVKWIVNDLDIGENTEDGMNKLMACMAWESGRTFSPSVTNMAGSGATGLIQFMPTTATNIGTTTAKLALMSAEDQLNYVWKYFAPYKGKLVSLADLYMAILWPAAISKPESATLWDAASKPTTYRQNAGLDLNLDNVITKAEATAKVTAILSEGLKEGNYAEYSLNEEAAPSWPPVSAPAPVTPPLNPAPVIVEAVEEPVSATPVTDKVSKAASGWLGNFAGVFAILGALLLNPDFSAQLGKFVTGLASGQGSWGALVALIGGALIAYRAKS